MDVLLNSPEFCLDEKIFITFPDDTENWLSYVSDWIDIGDFILKCDPTPASKPCLWVTSDFWETEINSNKTKLFDLWSDGPFVQYARDELVRIQILFDRCTKFDPVELPNLDFAIKYGYGRGWCISRPICALIVEEKGIVSDKIPGWDINSHYQVQFLDDVSKFYRSWLIKVLPSEKSFFGISQYAFPNLFFHENIRFNSFREDYMDIMPLVVKHLSFLNDAIRELFHKHKGQVNLIQGEAKASFDIDLSPESPNTHQNKQAMHSRQIQIHGHSIECEWHTKLYWDHGRIHFHLGMGREIPSITNNRIIIGIFADHLIT